jgi:CATRA-Associated Small Protein
MNPSSHDAPIARDDVADALSILRDVIEWSLAADRWAELDRSVTALAEALGAGDGGALRYEIEVLELLGPVRGHPAPVGDAGMAVSVPGTVRARILAAIETLEGLVPVTIFLSDGADHEQVESAVEQLLESAGLYIVSRADPVEGSWFRSMLAAARSPAARDALATALHTAGSRFVQHQDAQNTAMLMQNLGPLIAALQPTKDAAIRVGAFLVVKVDWVLVVHQLTPRQQLMLDHSPQLAAAPHEILHALGLHAAESGPAIPGNPVV